MPQLPRQLTGNTKPHRPQAARRLYRTFDRLTSLTDPARADRRSRLPQAQADRLAAAWHDHHHPRAAAALERRRWDRTTAVPAFARPPRRSKHLASIEITAGWHYSATLAVAARLTGGPIPSSRSGWSWTPPANAPALTPSPPWTDFAPPGLPIGLLAVDRAYTDQTATNFARPARDRGYQLVLDYEQGPPRHPRQRARRIPHRREPGLPLTPAPLAEATTGLDDKAVRAPSDTLLDLIAAREPFYLKLKQRPDSHGTFRLQCPAATGCIPRKPPRPAAGLPSI
ncbi:hypothetical protein Acsp03_23060 [Actinomadura sp. NBRC 104412]|uniref:hypothetical protein n=1 Tax=Actinomadura sp. NBRC 104412 TaxID=3032203 RepID=UPI0024A11FB1|nr:hypothetical protein [Actinomadura sp. NBRC 104412]GLZ04840.1 hypothetical protein Acsp03_23060 [Actinomadura sp. NBRC 104412]